MSWLATAIGGFLAGLFKIPEMIARWQARRDGRRDQRLSDLQQEVKDSQDAQEIQQQVDRMSDSDVDKQLQQFTRRD